MYYNPDNTVAHALLSVGWLVGLWAELQKTIRQISTNLDGVYWYLWVSTIE